MERRLGIDEIRRVVLETLAGLGMADANWSLVKETVLMGGRDGPGRRFQYDGVRAVWFTGNNSIEFFDGDGQHLKTISLDAPMGDRQAA